MSLESRALAREERRVNCIAEHLEVILTSKEDEKIKEAYERIMYIMDCTKETIDNKWMKLYVEKYRKIPEVEKEQIIEGLKEILMNEIKDNMLKEDFEDMFDKIKRWVNDNIHTEKDAEKFAEDPSPLMEELGLYTLENLCNYLEETFREDSDMMKGIKQSALLVDNMPIDEVVDSIYPIIKSDMESKDICIYNDALVKKVIKELINKQRTSIVVVQQQAEQEQPKEETNVKDAEFEEIDPITFDDSGLVEVRIVNLNSDGQTVIVRPLSDGTSNLVVEYSQLIQENNTTYIPLELFQKKNNFRDEIKDGIDKIVSRDEFKTLMKGIDGRLVRVDINPADDPNMFDSVMLNTEDKHIMIMLDFDGKYITKHSKVLVMFNQGESFIALPLSEGLFQELLTKNKQEFIKKNILSDRVMQLSDKLNLLDIPVSSFTTVINNILRNKSLREVILNSINKFFIFDGKITSKKFTITDGNNYYHYNNGKVTKSLVPSGK